ncbi:MAG TPA: lipid II flippase MurJ [Candidatus Paceibacterota bacterium]
MVRRVFNFMYKEVRGLHQAAYILALFAIGSQILAIVRDRLLAHMFGAGSQLDLYYAAFKIPDLMYVLFASVLSVYVLLPFVSRNTEEGGAKAGAQVLSQIFSIFLILFSVISLVLAFTAAFYVPYLFPGFGADAALLITLIQILLFQAFLLGLSTLCGVVTQISHRFILYAISPLLYNLGIILGVVAFYPSFGLIGLVIGVVIGAFGHLLIQLPFVVKSEYRFSLVRTFDWTLIKEVFAVSIPRALTLSLNQIVLLVFISIASTMIVGSVSVFQFAFNLQSVPLAVIGMSYSVAAFPTLSILLAKKKQMEFNIQLLTAMRHIIFWSVPIAGLIVVLRAQIVRVILGSGAFDWGDTRLTAAVLAIFVLSLIAQSILLLLIRAFYAAGKTKTPLFVACLSSIFSVVLAFALKIAFVLHPQFQGFLEAVFRLRDVPGTEILTLALAFIAGQFLQLVVLMMLSVKTFGLSYRPLLRLFVHALGAGFIGGLAAYGILAFVVDGVNQNTFIGITLQGLTAGVGGIVAIVLTYKALRAPELTEIYRSFHSKIFKTDVIAPQPDAL